MLLIRTIRQSDYSDVSDLIRTSFAKTPNGYRDESELVEKIREDKTYKKRLEVVAENNNQIVGHGLLSEIKVVNGKQNHVGLCLAPLSVLPSFQKSGVGTAIINELDNRAIRLGYRFVSVTGWPDYYSKFKYKKASSYHIQPPFPVPDDVFMIKPLINGGLDGVSGTVKYLPAFDK
ncbi:GNAT family N-acetyltransferase [Lentilactobacillus kefiri]|uniref:Acetyltransferase, GNAT family n=2 Tax=Lentilactobacillus kefiri TaxID=33962 RepID=A0A8E1V1R4_LENKE|nr:N-acetyltransferase [Lentilactobacillus kefiri]KRL72291.1 acetyltransferase, GNAT family [Lentilactobacillus parakefiri DSM 10551]KRM53938.1 acetyltransferase, GNAT family [Lentilactobacillus kefiri DSM 20587 = JCM 5818]MCJ2161349.1 N-acetyltransferase [Lentilactobacillus kefiri]MCP9368832.1 N-acetyltransferase [Lentilactobacillus kefiri]MDH5108680.1 N-acetyltransferase [Lentilactobacillus kefiri]